MVLLHELRGPLGGRAQSRRRVPPGHDRRSPPVPDHRAAGIGRKLVEAIIEHARQHVELLQLSVVADNMPARRLYASLGFVEYGIERHATKYQGEYHDDVLMALPLMVASGGDAARVPTTEISAEEVSA